MTEHNIVTNLGSGVIAAVNLVVGLVTMNTLNLIVAVVGLVAMLLANAYKIVVAFIQLRDLWRNKWRLPKRSQNAKTE